MGEAKKRELAVREQVVEALGLQTASGPLKFAGIITHRRRLLARWVFSSSFSAPRDCSIDG